MLPQNRVAARFFGLVEQSVGAFDQFADAAVIPFGDAAADGQIDGIVVEAGVFNLDADPFGHPIALFEIGVRHHDQKFFAGRSGSF